MNRKTKQNTDVVAASTGAIVGGVAGLMGGLLGASKQRRDAPPSLNVGGLSMADYEYEPIVAGRLGVGLTPVNGR